MSNPDETNNKKGIPFPRAGSVVYKYTKGEDQEKLLKQFKWINKYLVLPLYRIGLLPAIGFGWKFLILKTQGRISGKTRRTPVEYYWKDDIIHIFSGRGEKADWIKNARENPDKVSIRHGFHMYPVKIDIIENQDEKQETFKWLAKEHPGAAKMLFGWNPETDVVETVDFSNLIEMVSIVRLPRSERGK